MHHLVALTSLCKRLPVELENLHDKPCESTESRRCPLAPGRATGQFLQLVLTDGQKRT